MRRISIALSDRTLWIHGGLTFRSRPVHETAIDACAPGAWSGLREAVEQYLKHRRITRCEAAVQLLTPLVVTRVIQLPRLRPDEIQQAVERTPERFLPITREPHLISTFRLGSQKGGTIRVLATAVAASIPQIIRQELRAVGVSVKSVGCAHASWLDRSQPGRKARVIVVNHKDFVELLELDHGHLTGIRCIRPSALNEYTVPRNGRRPGVVVIAEPHFGTGLSHEAERSCSITKRELSAGEFTARYGKKRNHLVFRDAAERRDLERKRARRVGAHLVVACALLFGSAILERQRQVNALSAIEHARADLKPQLARAISAEQTALNGQQQLEFLQHLETDGERWTKLLTQLARHLPPDARLSSVRLQGDSVTLEGFSEQPQLAFNALKTLGAFRSISVSSPVVRERAGGNETQLRFTFRGLLDRQREH